jgi:hypothetical protein
VWRDKLAFTWNYRTFNFKPAILKAAADLLPKSKATNVKFLNLVRNISQPFPDFTQL